MKNDSKGKVLEVEDKAFKIDDEEWYKSRGFI